MNAFTTSPGRWKAIGLLVLVFVLGVTAGAGGLVFFTVKRLQRAAQAPDQADGPAEMLLARLESQVSSELDLTPGERQAVHEELEVTMKEIRALRVRLSQDATALVQDTLQRIEARLPEEKHAELRERARKRLRPWGVMNE